ncbi:AraC family transcriptional regulator [Pumilibacter intestinalis]|uniref:AraC family transcriptional regulator n=1 Tax=Pumilibacter intestinalis TaxID=2941511 RepID=UPI00203D9369|nr:AraC family transcriptional regulator [Pumilibacter intestinalis]
MQTEQYEKIWDFELCPIVSLHAIESEPHFHSAIEILIGRKGALRALINQTEYFVRPGDILVTNSYDVHGYTFCGEESPVVNVVIFPLDYVDYFFKLRKNRKFAMHVLRDDAIYKNATELLDMFDIARTTKKPSLAKCLGLALFEMIAVNIPLTQNKDEQADLIKDILHYLYANYREDISLSALSKKYGYSPNYFSALFHSYLNINLNEFVNRLRLNEIIKQVHNGADLITAVFDAGFNSLRTFYRAFHKKFDMTPKEYFRQSQHT